MSKYLVLFLVVLNPLMLLSQGKADYKFVNGKELAISGRPELVSPDSYHRIDSSDWSGLPKSVRRLATNSAGINIMFKTNSRSIKVKWTLEDYRILWNMTPLAVNGLDMYGWNGNSWQYVASAKPTDTINSAIFIKNLDGNMRHYKVYLPLYTGLKSIKIGIEKEAVIKSADKAFLPSKKAVIYGSSITQGASASRPGMAYPSIISRKLNVETFNLGFSGSGKMEIEMAAILGKMDADIFVLDCVPNPSPKQIKNRAIPFIKKLRTLKPNIPILMVESIFREKGYWDSAVKEWVTQQNLAFKKAYHQLLKEGYGQLYYIPSEELTGDDHGATVDGTHLSDLGQMKIANRVGQSIAQILLK